jgi:hypothetical protein
VREIAGDNQNLPGKWRSTFQESVGIFEHAAEVSIVRLPGGPLEAFQLFQNLLGSVRCGMAFHALAERDQLHDIVLLDEPF